MENWQAPSDSSCSELFYIKNKIYKHFLPNDFRRNDFSIKLNAPLSQKLRPTASVSNRCYEKNVHIFLKIENFTIKWLSFLADRKHTLILLWASLDRLLLFSKTFSRLNSIWIYGKDSRKNKNIEKTIPKYKIFLQFFIS